MVKTNVRFLALSLLMPAMALADWKPTQRDGAHAAVGGLLAFIQNKVGYEGQGLVLAKKDAALADHAKAAAASWTFGDGAVAAAFGRFHVEYAGKYANSIASQADTTVTLRDQFAATIGKIAANIFNSKKAGWDKVDSKTFTTAIDPFFVATTAQALYANRVNAWNAAQAAQAAYNAKKK